MQDFYEPQVGENAPLFRVPSTDTKEFRLPDLKGKWVVLYFYPKDDTPGCTKEACAFRDANSEMQKEGIAVYGVSTDSLESHGKFLEKYSLNFPLLSDPTSDVAKMYGAWKEKNLYGRRSWGVARMTYIIDPQGRVARVYKKVDPETHAAQVLADVREMKKNAK